MFDWRVNNFNLFSLKIRRVYLHTLKCRFDIHVYFPIEKLEMASSFYKNFLTYLSNNGITPTFSSFSKKTEGPHIGPNFTIQLMGINPNRDIQQEVINI